MKKRTILLLCAVLLLTGCSRTYPGPYCTNSLKTKTNNMEVDALQVKWDCLDAGQDAAAETIACMVENNTLPGISLTGSPQTVTVTVNSANTDTFTMVIDMTTGTYTIE
jgi:PBP1b-binding outer membrane lipoprotein LpoB